MSATLPKPGHAEALRQGCCCPVMDNHRGLGRGGDGARFGWYMSEQCPLHGGGQPPASKSAA